MAGHPVTGDQYRTIDRRMREIKRQLDQVDGSPLDPQKVLDVLQAIVEGRFDVTPSPSGRFIDCDTQSHIPNSWKIESHVKGGQLEFDPSKIVLYLEEGQKNGKTLKGEKLRKALESKPTLNACVLDFLLANTALIPESWKFDDQGRTRYIYFWGTVYRASDGNLYVRYLDWDDDAWNCDFSWLGHHWDVQRPAALAS